jgi:serine phosphatase RsbU (regulator of sigma subunit)
MLHEGKVSKACDLLFVIRSGTEPERTVELQGERFLIGREQDAALVLDHPAVSRRHTEIVRDPFGRWWIRDLGSRHGTVVNGAKISEQVLTERDEIRIAGFRIGIRSPTTSEPSPSDSELPRAPFSDAGLEGSASEVDLGAAPVLTGNRLRALIDLNAELNAELDGGERWRRLCATVSSQIPAGCTALVLRVSKADASEPPVQMCRVDHGRDQASRAVHVSRTLLTLVCRQRRPAVASNTGGHVVDARLSISAAFRPLAALACPLEEAGDGLDVLYILTEPQFAAGEWLAMATIAATLFRQAESTHRLYEQVRQHELVERDLERARRTQANLLPRAFSHEGWDVGIGFEPCRWVGGDYVDVIPCTDGRQLLLIADVCGKGLPAAMTTGNLHALIHANVSRDFTLAELIANVNTYLGRTLLDDSFVTMLAIQLDLTTGEYECITAGHPCPYRFSAPGVLEILPAHHYPPLGLMTQRYESHRGQLLAGEWLLCFTDGASDVCNESGQRLDTDGLKRLVVETSHQHHTASAAEFIRCLNEAIDAYQGRALPEDDRTFLAVRRIAAVPEGAGAPRRA